MRDLSLNRYVETCRSDLEGESAPKEIIAYLDRAESLIPMLEENPANFFNSFDTLMKEVKGQQKNYSDEREENQQLGWTFSSTRSNIDYDNKINQLKILLDMFEQMHTAAKKSKLGYEENRAHEVEDSPFIGRR